MAIDFENEEVLTMEQAAQYVPTKPCVKTIRNWIRVGVSARDGKVVRLEDLRLGYRQVTSKEAIKRFFENIGEWPE